LEHWNFGSASGESSGDCISLVDSRAARIRKISRKNGMKAKAAYRVVKMFRTWLDNIKYRAVISKFFPWPKKPKEEDKDRMILALRSHSACIWLEKKMKGALGHFFCTIHPLPLSIIKCPLL
jgi:hypothetical protein